jgi:hypothetical protein
LTFWTGISEIPDDNALEKPALRVKFCALVERQAEAGNGRRNRQLTMR